MALEISGRVIQILPEQTGTGRNGQWVRQDFVVETQEQFPRKVCFSAWGEKASLVKNLQSGAMVKVSFNAESREYNGRWYTDLRIWKIDQASESTPVAETSDMPDLMPPGEDEADDLPF